MDLTNFKPPKPRIHLILDWDGTMTLGDTTNNIGEAVLVKAREFANPPRPSEEYPTEPMAEYVRLYLHDVGECKASGAQGETQAEPDSHSLDKWRDIQTRSLLRVRKGVVEMAGVKEALSKDSQAFSAFLREQARRDEVSAKVKIREPSVLKSLLREMEKNGNSWSIISVSWSRSYILGAMIGAGLIESKHADAVARKIHCNEIMDPVDYDINGNPTNLICDRRDKLAELEKITGERHDPRVEVTANSDVVPIYIGDSTTDIDCLAASPAIGMHIHQGEASHPVWQMLGDMHVDRRSIGSLPTRNVISSLRDIKIELQKEERKKSPHIVCSIQSFAELRDWIVKIES